ncbi:putative zinc finger CCHC domain-containing protein 3-like [Apostichopus japonicus]|uniref:Putative zinc finger CCHC domain-containing protein 3-like n=1 Tax=Stichopus japonicus TaxID=307972 RepID=A0A2G8JS83_STIJA|nr:putative zinc finger CCHC domain-containing protein 3-like [Apostichopus japonicus]
MDGEVMLKGALESKGVYVTRKRLRKAIKRVEEGCFLRDPSYGIQNVTAKRHYQTIPFLQTNLTLLSAVEGLTVTPYERSVTVIHVGLEVRQELVTTVLGRFGAVKAIKMCSYAQAPGVFNGHRQVRIDLKQDIPSFLFIAGHKAHVRYPGQPRTCFRCGETGHEAKGCPNKKCGRCLRLGHDTSACPSEVVCSLCGKEGHVFRACPSSYVFMSGGQAKAPSSGAPTARRKLHARRGNRVRIHSPHLVHPPP